jgi:hypothetical protein
VGIRSTDPAFLDLLRTFIGGYAVEEKPDRFALFSADCGRSKTLPGGGQVRGKLNLYANSLLIYTGLLADEMAGRFVSVIRDMVTNASNEFVRVRAACVRLADGIALFPSTPNEHLPTLAAMLTRRGCPYVGDEIVNVDPVLTRVHPSALPLLIDADDLALFPELGRDRSRARRIQGKGANTTRRPVSIEEWGGVRPDPEEISRIIFPVFAEGATTDIAPVPTSEALFAMTRSFLNLNVWQDRALVFAKRLLEATQAERLVIGSWDEAVELLAPEAA